MKTQKMNVYKQKVNQNGWHDGEKIFVREFGPFDEGEAWAYADRLNARSVNWWYSAEYVTVDGEFVAV